jgi:putative phosphoribosyl transferase
MSLPFRDRHDAGRQLGEKLFAYSGHSTLVLGIPRGGVPVAYGIAHALHAPLDIYLVRHLAPPDEPASVFGTVGSGGVRVVRMDAARRLGLGQAGIDAITQRERISLLARERTYRGQIVEPDLRGRLLVLADDGSSSEQALKEAIEECLPISHTEVRALLSLSLAEAQSRELAGVGEDG